MAEKGCRARREERRDGKRDRKMRQWNGQNREGCIGDGLEVILVLHCGKKWGARVSQRRGGTKGQKIKEVTDVADEREREPRRELSVRAP